jgi:hypothetical protein
VHMGQIEGECSRWSASRARHCADISSSRDLARDVRFKLSAETSTLAADGRMHEGIRSPSAPNVSECHRPLSFQSNCADGAEKKERKTASWLDSLLLPQPINNNTLNNFPMSGHQPGPSIGSSIKASPSRPHFDVRPTVLAPAVGCCCASERTTSSCSTDERDTCRSPRTATRRTRTSRSTKRARLVPTSTLPISVSSSSLLLAFALWACLVSSVPVPARWSRGGVRLGGKGGHKCERLSAAGLESEGALAWNDEWICQLVERWRKGGGGGSTGL